MEIKKQVTVNAPFETVWDILFNQFDRIGEWTTSVNNSTSNPKAHFVVDGENLGGRVCESPFGQTVENFTHFDERTNSFTYEVESGLPGFVKHAETTYKVTPQGKKSVVDMHVALDLNFFPGKLMGPMMRMQMNKIIDGMFEELKHYAETGKIHPRVLQQQAA